jgi:MFS family permease
MLFFSYLLTSSITIPLYGKLADHFGRKRMLSLGVLVFLVGSVLCALSPRMYLLVAARAVQGCGVGAIFTVSYTIIGDVFPLAERGRAIGLVGSVWGIASIVGPVAGGLLIDLLSWHWIFLINVPFCVAALVMLHFSFDERFRRPKQRQPLFPRAILSRPSIIANALSFLTCIIMIGLGVYLPIYLQDVLGQGATVSGLILLPQTLTWLVMSFTLGTLLLRFGSRLVFLVVGALLLVGCAAYLLLAPDSHLVWAMVVIAFTGFGMGGVLNATLIIVQESVDYANRGAAMGFNSMLRSIAQTIGSALFGLLFNTVQSAYYAKNSLAEVDLANPYAAVTAGEASAATIAAGFWEACLFVFIAIIVLAALVVILSLFMPPMKLENKQH